MISFSPSKVVDSLKSNPALEDVWLLEAPRSHLIEEAQVMVYEREGIHEEQRENMESIPQVKEVGHFPGAGPPPVNLRGSMENGYKWVQFFALVVRSWGRSFSPLSYKAETHWVERVGQGEQVSHFGKGESEQYRTLYCRHY